MSKRMLVDGFHDEEIRVVIADERNLLEFDIETSSKKQTKGNIFLAKVTRVEPSLQAAFVEYGSGRQGFLPFSEIHPDYYQIPLADRQALLAEEEELDAAHEAEAAEGEATEKSGDDSDDKPRGKSRRRPRGNKKSVALATENGAEISETVETVEEAIELIEAAVEQAAEPSDEPVQATEQTQEEATETLANAEESTDSAEAEDQDNEMEELGGDDAHIQPKRQKSRRYKIQEVIKKNQIILIQVIKEERGNKGASVTSYISLPGRYCVLMPNSTKGGGVSRKINDNQERKRLKEVLGGLEMPKGMGLIMRTNGIGRSKPDLTRDYNYLIRLWNQIRDKTLASVAPALVYEEGNVITRSLRDLYQADFEEVLVAGEESYKIARDFMKMIMPSHVKKVIKYEEKVPLFQKHGIESQLASMYEPIVPMASGGYIVINATEALISVDVNSGRSTGERNVEDTATAINIEAAEEVARQLRLRDLAGLVVIDFIDMVNSRHRRQVENALKAALKSDRAKIQVGRISPFGLLEMSRQRLRSSLTEMNMIECPSCKGTGIIRSADSAMVQIIRSIESEVAQSPLKVAKVIVTTSAELALHFLNHKRKNISELEAAYGFELSVEVDHLPPAVFKVQLEWEDGNRSRIFASDEREGRLPQSLEGGKPKRRRGGKKFKERNENGGGDRGDRSDRGDWKDRKPSHNHSNNGDEQVVEPRITGEDGDEDTNAPVAELSTNRGEHGGEDRPKRRRGGRNRNRRSREGGEAVAENGEATAKAPDLFEASTDTADKPTAKPAKVTPIKAVKEVVAVAAEDSSLVSINFDKIVEEAVLSVSPAKKPAKAKKAPAADLPPENVIIDESTTKKKAKGGWWKKMVETAE